MYSERLLDHFRNPRNAGRLDAPAISVEVMNPACGDMLRLSALIEEGRIVRAAFLVKGCTASIAAGSAVTVWLEGRAVAEIRAMKSAAIAAAIEEEVGGLPAESKHAAALCADGVLQLIARVS